MPHGPRRWALAALLALVPPAAAAQTPPVPAPAPQQTRWEVARTDAPVRIDGVLDEPAWAAATAIPLPYEWFPGDNTPAPVETTALVTYDAERLLVAFRAADPRPGEIRARFAERDAALGDDRVGFMIDPFHDGRRAFQFQINPLGVQLDAVNSDVEGTEDFSWDAIWESAGRIGGDGYTVEVAIPFRQLRFPGAGAPQTWGFLAFREWPRSLQHRLRSIVTDQDRDCLVCQFQELAGFTGQETGRNLELTPTLTGSLSEERADFPDGRFETAGEELEPGLSVRWGVTPNVSLNATLNPDFSQVEADAAQLDVNERFALFFPEKRPFFLEGADLFETQLPLVFTRTVADPLAGLKVSGKQGSHAFGLSLARDRINNLILPASQFSSLATLDDEVTSGVLRYRRDLGATSAVGVLWTGREAPDYANHTAGVDGLYRFTDSDSVRYQLAGSTTRYPDAFAAEEEQPRGGFDGHALALAYGHGDRDWTWDVRYNELHPGFRADSGFVPRVGVRSGSAGAERRIRGVEGGWFSNLFVFLGVDGTREYDGAWNEWGSDLVFGYQGPRQSSVEVAIAPNQEHFEGVTYHNTRYSVGAEIQPTRDTELELEVRWGEAIDFTNSRQGEFVLVAPEVELRLGRRFQGEVGWTHQSFDVAGGRLFTVDLAQTRLLYHFGRRTYLRAILQYEWLEREPALYTVPVDRETEDLLTQLLFSYRLDAQTVLLVGYSDSHLGIDAIDLTQTDRTVFLKLGYAWLL